MEEYENEGSDEDSALEDEVYFNYLLSNGIIKEHSVDDDGEIVYTYDFETMKASQPEMYDMIMGGINDSLKVLLMKDLITVEYDEDLKAHFKATEKGIEMFGGMLEEDK